MKRFLKSALTICLVVFTFALCSCSKEEKHYTFEDTMTDVAGLTINVTLNEYSKSGEIVATNYISDAKNGTICDYTANSEATKVKVKLQMIGSVQKTYWFQTVYELKSDETTISLNDGTMLLEFEPNK